MLFFYAQTGGFYDDSINPPIPEGAIEITYEKRQALLEGEAAGKRISADSKGRPVLVAAPAPSDESLAAAARQWRDAEIESLKWLRERHRDEVDSDRATTLTPEQSGELLDYVQALRDWPAAKNFPAAESQPTAPGWIIEQTR